MTSAFNLQTHFLYGAMEAAMPSPCADSDACLKMATRALTASGLIDLHIH